VKRFFSKQPLPILIPSDVWNTEVDDARIARRRQQKTDFFKKFGGPINFEPVELGVTEQPQAPRVATLRTIQPHSIVEADPPKSPYTLVYEQRMKK
jgi:hypothetical protein